MSKLIKISKLAKDMGVTRQTLYNWEKSGKIKFIKSPSGYKFISEETYNTLLNIEKNNLEDNDNLQNNKSS